MSDALTSDALDPDAAVPSAPASGVAVGDASASGEAVVPASRFNGLMSKYQTDKSEWDAREALMMAELDKARKQSGEKVTDDADEVIQSLRTEVQNLSALVQSQAVESARDKVLAKYPGAAPFADLIVGNSVAEMEQVASVLEERLALIKGETPVVTDPPVVETPAEIAPAVPVVGGNAATAPGAATLQDKVQDALSRGDMIGFLDAQEELQRMQVSAEVA